MKAKAKSHTNAGKGNRAQQPKLQQSSSSEEEYGLLDSQLGKLFEDQLRDIYWAEKALVTALGKMARNATSMGLVEAIENHMEETKDQVGKLDMVFEMIGKKPRGKKCEAMVGLIKEGEEIMSEAEEGAMMDAGIIAAAQKVEHYEIATYGTLKAYAELMELDDAVTILDEILEEEKAADVTLIGASSEINMRAMQAEKE
jgi:ferritin-like metal-binding protein YciE